MRIQRLHHFAAFSMTGALLALGAFGQAPLPAEAAVNWAGQGKTGESLLKTEKTAQAGLKLLAEVAEKAPDAEPAKLQAVLALMHYFGNKIDYGNTVKYGLQALKNPKLDAKQKLRVLRDMADVMHGPPRMNFQFHHYYYNLCSEQDYARMKEDYPKYLLEILALDAADATARIDLGYHEILEGDPDKGMAELKRALENTNLTPDQVANAYVGLAEGAFAKNDRPAAIAFLKTLNAMNLNTGGRRGSHAAEFARAALIRLQGTMFDSLALPAHGDQRAFPKAQDSSYTEEFAPLTSARLELGPLLKADNVRVRLLKNKLKRFGVALDERAKFSIKIDTGALVAPDKSEGYALAVSRDGAIIQGHDPQGTLWGIVTLIQLINPAKTNIRVCAIRDWPDVANRGHAGMDAEILEFDLFSKINWVLTNNGRWTDQQRYTPLRWFVDLDIAREFAEFGLNYYMSFRFETMYPMIPLSSERAFKMHVDLLSRFAEAGAHAAWMYDDGRYPLHPQDVRLNTNGAAQDAAYITKVYRAVKAKNPSFKMIVCPPFYWGPYYSSTFKQYRKLAGGDERDAYNKSLRERLDPEIDVFWTGARMVSYEKTREDVEWAVRTFGRKPFIWQNRACPHYECSYIADTMPGWTAWHYEGFFGDIAGYMMNSHTPRRCAAIATCADALWNPKGYAANDSIRRSVAMLYGEKMYDILEPGASALGSLDKYWGYNTFAITPEFVADLPEIELQVRAARDSYDKAAAYNGPAMARYPGEYLQFLQLFEKQIQLVKSRSAATNSAGANPGR